jgi:hypothetical protein
LHSRKPLRALPLQFHSKIRVKLAAGTHIQEEDVNGQLRDKERCLAAMDRENVREMIEHSISDQQG